MGSCPGRIFGFLDCDISAVETIFSPVEVRGSELIVPCSYLMHTWTMRKIKAPTTMPDQKRPNCSDMCSILPESLLRESPDTIVRSIRPYFVRLNLLTSLMHRAHKVLKETLIYIYAYS